jgi:hypothetical protein
VLASAPLVVALSRASCRRNCVHGQRRVCVVRGLSASDRRLGSTVDDAMTAMQAMGLALILAVIVCYLAWPRR